MFPERLSLGPVGISGYGLMLAAGVAAAMWVLGWSAPRRNLPAGRTRDFCFWMILAGLLGSRIFYVVFHWPEFADDLWGIAAYWRGGLMFQGGVVGALLAAPFFLRRYGLPGWSVADALAPPLALGQALGRLGCFAAGCCYGRPGPEHGWGLVVFPAGGLAPAGVPLYAAQLYESVGLLVLALILFRALARSASRPGLTAALYLVGAGGLRFVMEHYRGDFRGAPVWDGLAPTAVAALAALAAGLGLLIWRGRKPAKF